MFGVLLITETPIFRVKAALATHEYGRADFTYEARRNLKQVCRSAFLFAVRAGV